MARTRCRSSVAPRFRTGERRFRPIAGRLSRDRIALTVHVLRKRARKMMIAPDGTSNWAPPRAEVAQGRTERSLEELPHDVFIKIRAVDLGALLPA